MDVDGQPVSAQGGDVDSSLLQQFNCLGTTDHDELISQMQSLMGVAYSTALFFLDMNNWNLQAAVCSYLDYQAEEPSTNSMSLHARTVSPISPDQQLLVAPAPFGWTMDNLGSGDPSDAQMDTELTERMASLTAATQQPPNPPYPPPHDRPAC